MRRVRWILAGLALVLGLGVVQHLRLTPTAEPGTPPEGAVRIATWNVHYILTGRAEGRWGISGWEARKGALDAAFKALGADIVAFQEMESFEGGNDDTVNLARSWLLGRNPDYAAAAVGDWRAFPSTQPVFYRTARLALVEQGWFFFSETPEVIYSRSFDGRYPAFASWAVFRDRQAGGTVRVLNVHFDAGSRLNRRRSAELVAERVGPWIAAGEAVVLAGDINAIHGSGLHGTLEAAGLRIPRVPDASFHFDREVNILPAIDVIGASEGIAFATAPRAVAPWGEAPPPSDHYPVLADILP